MERLRPVTFANVGKYGVFQGLDLDIPEGKFVPVHHRDRRHQSHHLVTAALEIHQRLTQHHQTSTFGIDDSARRVKVAHAGLHSTVRRESSGKHLWETATQVDSLYPHRKRFVV